MNLELMSDDDLGRLHQQIHLELSNRQEKIVKQSRSEYLHSEGATKLRNRVHSLKKTWDSLPESGMLSHTLLVGIKVDYEKCVPMTTFIQDQISKLPYGELKLLSDDLPADLKEKMENELSACDLIEIDDICEGSAEAAQWLDFIKDIHDKDLESLLDEMGDFGWTLEDVMKGEPGFEK
jgi:hypothetical protein